MDGSEPIRSTREESHPGVTWVSLFKNMIYFPRAFFAALLQFLKKPWLVSLRQITTFSAYLESSLVASVETSSAMMIS